MSFCCLAALHAGWECSSADDCRAAHARNIGICSVVSLTGALPCAAARATSVSTWCACLPDDLRVAGAGAVPVGLTRGAGVGTASDRELCPVCAGAGLHLCPCGLRHRHLPAPLGGPLPLCQGAQCGAPMITGTLLCHLQGRTVPGCWATCSIQSTVSQSQCMPERLSAACAHTHAGADRQDF